MAYDKDLDYKYIIKEEMLTILNGLEDGVRLCCNSVNNIAVMSKENVYMGYIDFLEGAFDSLEDGDNDA